MLNTNYGIVGNQISGLSLQGWSYGKTITIPVNSVDAELQNFPCTVYLNSSNFNFAQAKSDGSDIRFTDASLNQLKFENIEYIGNILPLYNNGNQHDKYSGAWVIYNASGGTRTFGSTYLQFTTSATNQYGAFISQKMIDFTNLTTITINMSVAGYNNTPLNLRYSDSLSDVGTWIGDIATGNVAGDITIDVSAVEGYHYLCIYQGITSTGGAGVDARIYSINCTTVSQNAKFNVLLPAVSDLSDTILYMWYGNPNAYNTSIESWQDQTGKSLIYNGNVALKPNVAKFDKAAYFDGTGDYIQIPDSTDFDIASNKDYTLDFWIQPLNTSFFIFDNYTHPSYYYGFAVRVASGIVQVMISNSTTVAPTTLSSTTVLSIGKMYHIAFVKNGTTATLYINGVAESSVTMNFSTAITSQPLYIGCAYSNGTYNQLFNGYLDEYRVSKGVARWTSNFAPPQTAYIVDSYTKLLLHFDDYDAMRIATSTTGTNQCYFLKTGVYSGTSTKIIAGECRVKVESSGSTEGLRLDMNNCVKYADIILNADNVKLRSNTQSQTVTMDTTSDYHTYMLTLDATDGARLFIDGNTTPSATIAYASLSADTTGNIYIGDGDTAANNGGSSLWKWVRTYTDYGTSPTVYTEWNPTMGKPSSNGWTLGGTDLSTLLFKDETGKITYTYGNTCHVKTAYADGARGAYFDGTGDYFTLGGQSDFAFGTGDFCVETNAYLNTMTDSVIYDGRASGVNGLNLTILYASGTLSVFVNGSVRITGSATQNAYHNITVLRTGTSLMLFVDGAQSGNTWTDTTNYASATSRPIIGASGYDLSRGFNGYILGMRITKGRARYTAAFTPPTSFSIDGSDVVFCTNFDTIYDQNYAMVQHMGDSLVDATGNNNSGTATGTTVVTDANYGKCRSFNGTSDKIAITDSVFLEPFGQDHCVLVGVIQNALTNYRTFISKGASSSARTFNFFSYNSMYGMWANNGATDDPAIIGVGTANTSPAVMAISRLANLFKLWKDGASFGNDAYTGSLIDTAGTLNIGVDYAGTGNYYSGSIFEVRYEISSRSDAWIKAESLAIKNSLITIS